MCLAFVQGSLFGDCEWMPHESETDRGGGGGGVRNVCVDVILNQPMSDFADYFTSDRCTLGCLAALPSGWLSVALRPQKP